MAEWPASFGVMCFCVCGKGCGGRLQIMKQESAIKLGLKNKIILPLLSKIKPPIRSWGLYHWAIHPCPFSVNSQYHYHCISVCKTLKSLKKLSHGLFWVGMGRLTGAHTYIMCVFLCVCVCVCVRTWVCYKFIIHFYFITHTHTHTHTYTSIHVTHNNTVTACYNARWYFLW